MYRVSYKYADSPEDNQVKNLAKVEILFQFPEIDFLISDPNFYTVKWVVDLVEVTITRIPDDVDKILDDMEKEVDEPTKEDFETALKRFMETAQDIVDYHMSRFPGQFDNLVMMRGKRYIRIVSESGMEHTSYNSGKVTTSRSAWAFIDMTNGDILKPATWKAPAKHARGNIYDKEYSLTPYGPPYLK